MCPIYTRTLVSINLTQTLVVAGTRALDLALCLKYAGFAEDAMTIVPPLALRAARAETLQTARSRHSTKQKPTTSEAKLAITRNYGLKKALDSALEQTPPGETLFIVPTYTGLLEVHHELEQRGLTPHYWEGRDA